jgi:hypothetical protein
VSETRVLDGRVCTFRFEPLADVLLWWGRDGLTAKLRKYSPRVPEHRTRLVMANYEKGFVAGIGGMSLDDNPWKGRQRQNFMRGKNNPDLAWQCGWMDGERIRQIAEDPARTFVPELRAGEVRLLPADYRERVEDYESGVTERIIVTGSISPVECVVTERTSAAPTEQGRTA